MVGGTSFVQKEELASKMRAYVACRKWFRRSQVSLYSYGFDFAQLLLWLY